MKEAELIELIHQLYPMAVEGTPKPGHTGSCGPWESCDCDCMAAASASEPLHKAWNLLREHYPEEYGHGTKVNT